MARAISAYKGLPDGVLTPKQEEIAVSLAAGSTLQGASRKAGVGETTVKRWLKDPALTRRVTELRAQMTGRALAARLSKGFS
jgi:hypothetical protein